ncbi:MAG TPA: hypothetical protein VN873_10700 [Candidatus Angelobacter sp.]|nr:hypothetical protein [Candidatus Angelobacter sp.]
MALEKWADTGNQNAGLVVLAGTNTYTGGTFIGGAGIVLGDGITPGGGSIVGSVVFTNTTDPSVDTFSQNKTNLSASLNLRTSAFPAMPTSMITLQQPGLLLAQVHRSISQPRCPTTQMAELISSLFL